MAIQIADGFQLRVAKPLDDRQNVETVAQLDPTYGYEGQIVYVKDVKQFYTCYKNENGSLAYKVMENGGGGGSSEEQIKDWVRGSSYLEGDYIYREGEIYRCLASNSDVDFDEANWIQVTYGIDELSKEDVERLLGLTEEEIEAMADLILDTEIRLDKTYSSSKIYQDIQQCLNDSKTFTLLELSKFSGVSYKIVASTSEMTSESIIYLLANGNTYDMYIVEENGATTKIGDMDVNLDNYFTKAEIEADYLKKADADGKYATITTVDGKIDKDKIVTVLDDTVTDDEVPSARLVYEELDKKFEGDNFVKKDDITDTIDINSSGTKIPNVKAIYDDVIEGRIIDQTVIDTYGTEILKYPVGIWRFANNNVSIPNKFLDLPVKTCGRIEITTVDADTNKNPWSNSWSCRVYNFETYSGMNYFRKLSSAGTAGVIAHDIGWQRVCITKVEDVGVTTITPVNSDITGTIEYTVKNGICYVSLFNVKSTTTSNGLSISTTMPKPAINSRSAIVKQVGNGNIGIVFINKNTTQLRANIYISDIIGDCTFSYPVAE